MPTLIIMRGLPGSGKSTRARELQPDLSLHCSADLFHTTPDGKYIWSPTFVGESHKWCQLSAMRLMRMKLDNIVIDNTNIKRKDFQVYLDFADKFGYDVRYETSSAWWAWDVDECSQRNTHSVPTAVIQRMKDNYEP